ARPRHNDRRGQAEGPGRRAAGVSDALRPRRRLRRGLVARVLNSPTAARRDRPPAPAAALLSTPDAARAVARRRRSSAPTVREPRPPAVPPGAPDFRRAKAR